MSRIKIAGVQMDVQIADAPRNLLTMRDRLSLTTKEGALITVFPECSTTGYCFESLNEAIEFAQPVNGENYLAIERMCVEFNTCVIYGFLEVDGDRIYNSAAMVGPSGLVGYYRKLHLPFLGVDRFTTPGNRLDVFELKSFAGLPNDLRVGLNICYDCSFPESARVLMLKGADLIVLPTNWPPTSGLASDFIPNARALENHVYFISVNRVGTERGFTFIGKSKFCDPSGREIDFANHNHEAIIYGEIDPNRARQKHLVNIPGVHEVHRLKDRRPDMYGELVLRDDGAI
jgi:predicted amidohydrolase